MSEISISKKGFGLSCVVLHLLHFFFFLLSHPLYFSFFIFFFPYFLKLLSFLSPLFITTFLLLFAFFSLFLSSPPVHHLHPQFADSPKMGFLATTYQIVFDSLRPRTPDETHEYPPMEEELEAYKIVFEAYTFGSEQNPYGGDESEYIVPEVDVQVDCEELGKTLDVGIDCEEPEKILDVGIDCESFPEKIISFPENQKFKEIKAKTEESEQSKIEGKTEEKNEIMDPTNEMIKDLRKLTEESSISSRSESSPWSSPGSFSREYSLGSYGSMRKEKEWRRTLACKLFEERHNSEGTEGMDSLWETYEKSESKKLQRNEKINGKSKRGKKIEEDEDGEDEEEEMEDGEGQLCCLQALKFSAGKMNLGMGRPNLVKMTKALKGFGWLSRNGRSRKRLIH